MSTGTTTKETPPTAAQALENAIRDVEQHGYAGLSVATARAVLEISRQVVEIRRHLAGQQDDIDFPDWIAK
jgi:hypothetical protein